MTLGLRRIHGLAAVALAVAVPTLLAASILVRRPMPSPVRESFALPPSDVPFLALAPRIEARIVAVGNERQAVDLRADAPPQIPDLLVYWVPVDDGDEGLPVGALLLGSIGGTGAWRFSLPRLQDGTPGVVLLYSLARQARVARLPVSDPRAR